MIPVDNQPNTPALLLQLFTPDGVFYEKFIVSVMIRTKTGKMLINKNYSSVLEQLVDGELIVKESKNMLKFDILNSWMIMNDNKCSIYSTSAKLISK